MSDARYYLIGLTEPADSAMWLSMTRAKTLEKLAALAQPTRLSIYELLVRTSAGLQVGQIASKLEILQNGCSTHLSVLRRADLVSAMRHGRATIYRAQLDGLNSVETFFAELRAELEANHGVN